MPLPTRPLTILIAGASGFIGRHLRAAAERAGHRVVPIDRRHGQDFRRLDTPAAWRPLLDGVDAVVNAVGIIGESEGRTFAQLHTRSPIALFDACRDAGVGRIVQISALGADVGAFSDYHLSKRAADEHLRALGVGGFVLRPSLVYGPGGASTRAFLRLSSLPVIPVPGDGAYRVQPVHVGDLVAAVLRCLDAPPGPRTIDVVGPTEYTFADWLQALRAGRGRRPAPLLHVPMGLLTALTRLAAPLHPMARVDNLRMLQAGNVADAGPLTGLLGRPPRALAPALLLAADAGWAS